MENLLLRLKKLQIQMRMKSRIYIYLILILILSGCGFTSGSYQDILKAQDYISKREYKKAVKLYENILSRRPTKNIQIKISYQLAEINSLYLNNYTEALSKYKKVISLTNEPLWQTKALEKMGMISFENLKDYSTAKYSYKKLKEFIPKLEKQSFYKLRYALCFYHSEEYKKTLNLLKDFIVEDNSKYAVQAYYYIGLVNFYEKKWDTAISYWFEYLKREKQKSKIVQVKFLIANAYESSEKLKEAYNIYYSILGSYPNPKVIKNRLNSLYQRRVARKR